MSVDTVNQALTKVRIRLALNDAVFSRCARIKMLEIMGVLRYWLMKDNVPDFNIVVNNYLRNEPDCMDIILNELFQELGCKTREDLDVALALTV